MERTSVPPSGRVVARLGGVTAIAGPPSAVSPVTDGNPTGPMMVATPVVLSMAYTLHPAAPNPFNPMTTIKFSLPAEAAVTINVYDTAGRRVKTLLEGVQSAGTHEVTFKADRLGSGVYFYEMRAGNFREIRKMTLVKKFFAEKRKVNLGWFKAPAGNGRGFFWLRG